MMTIHFWYKFLVLCYLELSVRGPRSLAPVYDLLRHKATGTHKHLELKTMPRYLVYLFTTSGEHGRRPCLPIPRFCNNHRRLSLHQNRKLCAVIKQELRCETADLLLHTVFARTPPSDQEPKRSRRCVQGKGSQERRSSANFSPTNVRLEMLLDAFTSQTYLVRRFSVSHARGQTLARH